MKKHLFLLLLLLGFGELLASNPPNKPRQPKKTAVVNAMQFFVSPEKLLACWGNDYLPVERYSAQEIGLQQQINDTEDGIITYSPKGSFSGRDIDQIEITPYTWKWITLEHHEADGTYTKATLRRPNAWLIANQVTAIGAKHHLQVPAAGIDGQVTVTAISPSQLDTRFWNDHRQGDYVSRPITGFFEHTRSNVVALKFVGQDGTTEVTDNHLFFSQTRNDWISVQDLTLGENIKTRLGIATLEAKTSKTGTHTVYDLELYKDHNFLAGNGEMLVHNSCSYNGNSKLSTKPQHGYEIKTSKGVEEYGISGQKLNANGTSPRVAQKLNAKYKGRTDVSGRVVEPEIRPGAGQSERAGGLDWEQGKVNGFSLSPKNPTPGIGPPNQIRPKPNM